MVLPERVSAAAGGRSSDPGSNRTAGLVAKTGADGDALAANGATAAQYRCACLGLHTRTEAVGFHALAAIGLKCALGHENALLFPCKSLCLDGKYLVYRILGSESSMPQNRDRNSPKEGPKWTGNARDSSHFKLRMEPDKQAFFHDSGNLLVEFHQHWCNLQRPSKSLLKNDCKSR